MKWLTALLIAAIFCVGLNGCGSSDEAADGESSSGYGDGYSLPTDIPTDIATGPKLGMHDGEWIAYGGDKGSTKYSSADQITKDNVKDLVVAWEWESPDGATAKANPDNRGLVPFLNEVTPIVVNGVMYASTSFSQVAAINPVTGETIWVFDTESWRAGRPTNLGFVHRGVSYWADGDDERIFIGTGDMKLWSIDAKTGQPAEEFNGGKSD